MRRLLSAAACLLLLYASPVAASITCEGTGATSQNTTDPSNLSYTIPANSNQFTFVVVHDRSESLSDPVMSGGSCTWTKRAGPMDLSSATNLRVWMYEGANCTSGATTISADLSATQNTAITAGSCWSTSATFAFVSAGGSGAENTVAGTSYTSETRTCTDTCVILSGIGVNNLVSFSAVGTNQDDMLSGTASRAHLLRRLESSGTFSTDGTIGSAVYDSATLLYQETTSAGAPRGLLTTGVGEP